MSMPRQHQSIRDVLTDRGLALTRPVFSASEIDALNARFDPLFARESTAHRAYVYGDGMHAAGVFDLVFNPRMRDLIASIMPDPVLYHLHAYEIAARSTASHIFAENSLGGWHRDGDCEYHRSELTHISIFVYLTEVGPQDGPFEFIPRRPTQWLNSKTPITSLLGPAGTTFAWQRSFYHRAAANRGPVRRRLLKLSIQRNRFPSIHLANEKFRKLTAAIPAGDAFLDTLLGRYQGQQAPFIGGYAGVEGWAAERTGTFGTTGVNFLNVQLRQRARLVRDRLRDRRDRRPAPAVAYD